MDDVRCQKLESEFGLRKILAELATGKKKLTIPEAMALAIYIAYRGAQRVSPNPLVGCVVLDRNEYFLSMGWHEFYGGPHAEINALKGLDSEQLQDATMIVTLEPCAHVGKTGSCALRIKDLPLKKVIYGIEDPNPLVSGKGAKIIKDSGKEALLFSLLSGVPKTPSAVPMTNAITSSLVAHLEVLTENFLKNFREKKSFVALKWAQSLDGKMALRSFESQWITNSQSREYAHYLRSIHDVLIVGAGTVLKDNPKLNIRLKDFDRENKILILDAEGSVFQAFEKLEIAKNHKKENVYFVMDSILTGQLAVDRPGDFNNVLFLHKNISGYFPLESIHQFCFERGMSSILVEGGPGTLNQYFKQGAFDRVYSFIAPVFLGDGLTYSNELTIPSMPDKIRLAAVEKMQFAEDTLITGILWPPQKKN